MERSTILQLGKSTISMAIFNSYFDITQRVKTWGWVLVPSEPQNSW